MRATNWNSSLWALSSSPERSRAASFKRLLGSPAQQIKTSLSNRTEVPFAPAQRCPRCNPA